MSFSDTLAKGLDATIGIFSPANALKRQMARQAAVEFGSYSGAKNTRITNGWLTQGGSAIADIDDDLPALRGRSRDMIQNNGKASGIIDRIATNVIGQGIRPQPRLNEKILGISETEARGKEDEMKEWFRAWVPYADAGNRLSFYGLEYQAFFNLLGNGESLYLPQSVESEKTPVSLRLFGIESDRLETPPGEGPETNTYSGIKIGNKYGEPQKYWFKKTHPGDSYSVQKDGYVGVKAEDKFGRKLVFHNFLQERSGQTRGVPILAPVLTLLDSQQAYLEAELVRARLRACIGLVVNEGSSIYGSGGPEENVNNANYEGMEPGQIWRFGDKDDGVKQTSF